VYLQFIDRNGMEQNLPIVWFNPLSRSVAHYRNVKILRQPSTKFILRIVNRNPYPVNVTGSIRVKEIQ
jgi:hypothetical protein